MTSTIPNLLKYMNYVQKGMSVHTDNLNRSDIPGEKPYALKPFSDQLKNVKQPTLETTSDRHFSFTLSGLRQESATNVTVGTQKLKTNINSEEELHKANQLGTELLKATRVYQKSLGLFRTILK